jgi:GntR family transcriptional regulator
VLRTFRVVYSDDDVPVEATIMAKAGHLYELRYDVT